MEKCYLVHHGIKGQKWGVRRYQNKDGSLTNAGKKRYDRDVLENQAKKKDSRIIIDKPDPNRWVKEDLSRTKKTIDLSEKALRSIQNIEKESRPKSTKKKMDLSSMTDQELRSRISRAQLEKQYNDMFAPEEAPKISNGRKYLNNVLEYGGQALAIAGSAVGLALAIKELRG